jgi:predicted enzyme related to lactoylglutathione lyase
MSIRYVHTNIIAKDWRALAAFYAGVFGCTPVPPERDLSGGWVDDLTGLAGARITGTHMTLPGSDATLEIFSYEPAGLDGWRPVNRPGYGHIAFHVDDVEGVLSSVTAHGGQPAGEVVTHAIPGVGALTVVYACDPEGNVIELQHRDE